MSAGTFDLVAAVEALLGSLSSELGIKRSVTDVVRLNNGLFQYLLDQGVEQKQLPTYLCGLGWLDAGVISHKTFSAAIGRVRREREAAAVHINLHETPTRDSKLKGSRSNDIELQRSALNIAGRHENTQISERPLQSPLHPLAVNAHAKEKPPDALVSKNKLVNFEGLSAQNHNSRRELIAERRLQLLKENENE